MHNEAFGVNVYYNEATNSTKVTKINNQFNSARMVLIVAV